MQKKLEQLASVVKARAVAVSVYDYETESAWSYQGDRWFHAASTIKVAVLVALFAQIEKGKLHPRSRLHVRNWFHSVADGTPYRVSSGRDANSDVHAAIGKTMRLEELALHMITTSSNLATNLLVDLLSREAVQETLTALKVQGVDFQRGVEDDRAYEAGISNRLTANGLVSLFRAIHDDAIFAKETRDQMLDILGKQEFTSGIPAGVPGQVRSRARFAHKTGEISTVAHDGGFVFLPDRQPYALAILTEWEEDQGGRREAVAEISKLVYGLVTDKDPAHVR